MALTVKNGDYVLQTNPYNTHYMIIYDNGKDEPRTVMHCACTKRLTKAEAERHLERAIKIINGGGLE